MIKLLDILKESITPKKSCSCGCNTCGDKKKLNEGFQGDEPEGDGLSGFRGDKSDNDNLSGFRGKFSQPFNSTKEKYKIVYGDDETESKQLFDSEEEAEDFIDSINYDFENIDYDDNKLYTLHSYTNPEDNIMYYGARVQPHSYKLNPIK